MRGISVARVCASLTPTVIIAGALFSLIPVSSGKADEVADFYKGKRLTMFVGSSAGDGTDLYGRLIARYMSRKLPGNPQVVATNVPGANGLIAANQLYNLAPRDGSCNAGLRQ